MSETLHEAVTAAYEKSVSDASPEPEVARDIETSSDEEKEIAESVEPDIADAEEEDEAPDHWPDKDKEVFRAVDKNAKAFLLRRHKEMEAGYTKKQQALAEEKKIADNFRKAIEPHAAYLKQLNIDPIDAFNKLVSTEMRLRMANPQERGALINGLARQYGAQFDPNAPVAQIDPKTQLILDELNRQKALIDSMQNEKKEAQNQSNLQKITSFSDTKDKDGKPKYPHFEAVRVQMGKLINAGAVKEGATESELLENAYTQAILGDVELRKEYIANLNRREVDHKKVSESKRAGFNVKSSGGGSVTDTKKDMSLAQTIRAAYDAQAGGNRI